MNIRKNLLICRKFICLFLINIIFCTSFSVIKAEAASTKIEKVIQWAIDIANDNSHGYSQSSRLGPDYDCSSYVGAALAYAGFSGTSGFTTRTMGSVLQSNGFTRYTYSGVSSLQRGDIMVTPGKHTEIYLGGNQLIGAHDDYDGRTGDSSGKEICTGSFYNYPWTYYYRYTGDDGNNPTGTVDSVTGGTGYINVRGWAFDKDDTSQSLNIHVYIGGPAGVGEGHIITANAYRNDVHNAYDCGNYHGFDDKISTKKTGSQTVYIYAINIGGGSDNTLIGTKSANISKDSTAPVISNVKVTQSSIGYTVTCTATDSGSGVDRVQFPTWTTNKGQDDIFASWQTNSRASGIRNGNTYTYTVKYSDHNNEKGEYNTHIYAYDECGNYVAYPVVVTPVVAPSGYSISVDKRSTYVYNNDNSNQVTVYCTVSNGVSCTAKLIVEKNGSVYGTFDFGSGSSITNYIVFPETGTYEIYFELTNEGGTFRGAKGNGSQTITVTEKPKEYTVSYNANGGSGVPSSQIKKQGVNLTLSSTKPTRTGYSFVKWNTKADGTGTSYLSGGTYTANSGTILYAIWEANKYTITYNANGGSGAPGSQTKTYGQSLTLSSTKPTRTGYSFVKWNTKADGTGTSYLPGGAYTANSGVTLYAIWEANKYTITYDANGGTGAPSSQTINSGQIFTISSVVPRRDGYDFKGWSKNPNAQVVVMYMPGSTLIVNENITLYAVWKENSQSQNLTVRGSDVYGGKGETVDVSFTIENNPGIATIGFDVNYDTEAIELTAVKVGNVFSSAEITEGEIGKNPYTVSALCVTGNKTANGKIVTLTFKIKGNCKSGKYDINISNYEAFNIDEKAVDMKVVEGSVTVSDVIKGDINSDGTVNRNDLLRLGKYFAGQSVEINEAASDVNNDGIINRSDLLRMGKYFAGWDVKLG